MQTDQFLSASPGKAVEAPDPQLPSFLLLLTCEIMGSTRTLYIYCYSLFLFALLCFQSCPPLLSSDPPCCLPSHSLSLPCPPCPFHCPSLPRPHPSFCILCPKHLYTHIHKFESRFCMWEKFGNTWLSESGSFCLFHILIFDSVCFPEDTITFIFLYSCIKFHSVYAPYCLHVLI